MENNKRLYVDIHVLQTVPPSCVNRDDTGSPKIAVYGGTTRARVSSQSWKRAVRLAFSNLLKKEDIGIRTKSLKSLLIEKISEFAPENAEKLASAVINESGLKLDKDGKTSALFFISQAQIDALAKTAELLHNGSEVDKEFKELCKKALAAAPSIDLAMFGRMVADDPSLNFDAAVQVAHAISTHTVHNEFDYFTAVDDCAPKDNAGAAHLGTVEYNSSTLYRYATVNVCELEKHLGNRTAEAVKAFVEAFATSMPTGKQNTFANRTLPDTVYVALREDQPVNLVGAFEKPVQGRDGYVEGSVKALSEKIESVCSDFVLPAKASWCVGKTTPAMGEKVSLNELLNKLEITLKEA